MAKYKALTDSVVEGLIVMRSVASVCLFVVLVL